MQRLRAAFSVEAAEPGIAPGTLAGLVIDDTQAKLTGKWSRAANLKPYVGQGYLYAGAAEKASARYEFSIKEEGRYEVRINYGPHENRATKASVTIASAEGEKTIVVNERAAPPLAKGFISLGTFRFAPGKGAAVTISNAGADGYVHADAVQLVPQP